MEIEFFLPIFHNAQREKPVCITNSISSSVNTFANSLNLNLFNDKFFTIVSRFANVNLKVFINLIGI